MSCKNVRFYSYLDIFLDNQRALSYNALFFLKYMFMLYKMYKYY